MTTFQFLKANKKCQVVLHSSSLEITYLKNNNKPVTVDISYVYLLAVKSCSDNGNHYVSIHYVKPIINRRLRVDNLILHADLDSCDRLVQDLKKELAYDERPHNLVVFINPNSGKKRGEKVFSKKVQPLFHICGIQTKVIVTKAAKEARDVLQTLDLEGVDGLVTVGGDGLYCEVMNGLILRTQKDNGVNVHDPDSKVVRSRLPIGIIPAGTGDMVVQYLHGTRDVMTAVLRVILGVTLPSNAVSVHQGGQLSAYSGLLLAFGLQGDMMADCERFRWMGHSRYNVIPVSTVLNRRSYDLEVEYEEESSLELKRTSDVMYSVDTYVVSKEKRGERFQHVFGADTLKVYMTSKCSLNKHMQQLVKLKDNDSSAFDYEFVTEARVQGYTVRLPGAATTRQGDKRVLRDKYNMSCDGEVLKVLYPELHVRLHHHAVRVFGEAIV